MFLTPGYGVECMVSCVGVPHKKILQGVEQSTANIMYFSLAEKLYPNSGYHSETGGYLQNLRNSTNIEKVRDYHRQFYRWSQLIIFITKTCLRLLPLSGS